MVVWTVDCSGGLIFRGWRILLPGESGVWGVCTVQCLPCSSLLFPILYM